MRFISWLLDQYDTNPDAHWLVDYHDIWVMPTFNPDGHHIVEAGGGGNSPYYYRKNGNNTLGNCAIPPTPYDRMAGRLQHEHIRAAHVLLNLNVSLAVAEARDLRLATRQSRESAQTSSHSGSLAVPQKILNLSSTRPRWGLRSGFSSAFIWAFFSVAVARVAIGSSLAPSF